MKIVWLVCGKVKDRPQQDTVRRQCKVCSRPVVVTLINLAAVDSEKMTPICEPCQAERERK